MASVSFRNVEKSFGSTRIIHRIGFNIADGEFTVLVGPSGCGKSTLLRMLAGLEEISGGTIAIDDLVVNDIESKDRDIAMVFQSYTLYPHMTVGDNMGSSDAKLRVAMRAEIKALHQRLKTTTVYVTHDQVEAMTMADRIVVMQEGRIEQIGTPLELYNHPANLFVAQFIGSPAMNVVHGILRRGDGQAWVEAEGGVRWPIAPAGPGAEGEAVAYGIRPGDMGVRGAAGARSVPAKVIVVEPTGAETELLVRIGSSEFVVVLHGRTRAEPGEKIHLSIDTAAVHLFDPTSGTTLTA